MIDVKSPIRMKKDFMQTGRSHKCLLDDCPTAKMLRRNRFGFRMRRRSITSRLLQLVVVLAVLGLFIYLLIYALSIKGEQPGPDYSWLRTRNMSAYLRPLTYDTTLLEPSVGSPHLTCTPESKTRLLILIHTATANERRREVIRKTWLGGARKQAGLRALFVLGKPSGAVSEEQEALVSEHEKHGDLLQFDFIDSYLNLTLKTSFMFKWLDSRPDCLQNVKFVMKCDDDSFVNPKKLWDTLEHALLHTTSTKSLGSYLRGPHDSQEEADTDPAATPEDATESLDYLLMGSVMATVPIRDASSKWYIPTKFYPLNIFPRFLSGTGYVFSTSVVPILYRCALKTPYLNLEDVFITGLCATTQLGLKLTNEPAFRWRKPFIGPDYLCYYKTSALVHPLSTREIEDMWEKIGEDHNCETFYFSFVQAASVAIEFMKNIIRV